ncbi:MAG: DUF4143 domain-containing protein [bacterium]|nr:DUF4143 domain-containing protein [bacterium]
MFERSLHLPAVPKKTFFLWGPRKSGKSTLLKSLYPQAHWLNLLKTDEYIQYLERPYLLRERLLANPQRLVVIDEVQKIPALLDEVHWLIENTPTVFVLCGSSARKVKRGHANLLGGRALRHELFGLVSEEIGLQFDLVRLLNTGYIPSHYLSDNPREEIFSYVNDYLKEEIAAEGLVQNLPTFSDFLRAASLSDTEIINYSNIARECGVSMTASKAYFQILVDTLLGHFVPAYTRRQKRRVILAPKFYHADVGIVNYLAKRGNLESGSELFGKAFENWVFHELLAESCYHQHHHEISYWRLAGGTEVDFIINDFDCAIEVKASSRISNHHLRGLRELSKDHRVKKRVIVSLEPQSRKTADQIDILSVDDFRHRLWGQKLLV